jgi:phosphatidylserine decarboxylase
MPEQSVSTTDGKVRLPGLDPAVTPIIGLGLGLAGILLGLRPRLAAWPLALTAAAALLYRDPDRATPNSAEALFAPADGELLAIADEYEHRFLHTDAVRLSIEVSPLNVPVQRSPAAGTVAYLEHVEGSYRAPWDLRGSETAESGRQFIGISTGWGPLLLVITAGPLARRIGCRLAIGDHVQAGERLATVRFGARVDLLLPRDAVGELPTLGAELVAGVSRVGRVVQF